MKVENIRKWNWEIAKKLSIETNSLPSIEITEQETLLVLSRNSKFWNFSTTDQVMITKLKRNPEISLQMILISSQSKTILGISGKIWDRGITFRKKKRTL